MAGSDVLRKGIRARSFNGKETFFWRDLWLEDIPLLNLSLKAPCPVDSFKMVREYWNDSCGWDWNALECMLLYNILGKMGSVMVSTREEGNDGVCWGLSKDRRFSLKSVPLGLKQNLPKMQLGTLFGS